MSDWEDIFGAGTSAESVISNINASHRREPRDRMVSPIVQTSVNKAPPPRKVVHISPIFEFNEDGSPKIKTRAVVTCYDAHVWSWIMHQSDED